MQFGAFTSYIDLAQIVLYAFWIFFAGLIFYLRREDKREGYPLESDRSERASRVVVQGFPAIPEPKVFDLPHGGTQISPRKEEPREIAAEPVAPWPGAPLEPTGNPMLDGVGPAAYALRAEAPERTAEGDAKIVPLHAVPDFVVDLRDQDPRGMDVVTADNQVAGKVVDIWVDRSEHLVRYLEVEVPTGETARRVLLPMGFARVSRWAWHNSVKVESLMSHHFADVPGIQNPNEVTMREEDRICAYFASGHLYAHPWRQEPVL